MRKLATIQIIEALDPIPNADKIEVASILGWKAVVQKGMFQVGDRCVYFEVDSWLPEHPEYEFLRKSCWKENENGKGHRIKTIRLKKQISQGLVMPIQILEHRERSLQSYDVGADVTEILDVKLYNPPIPACLKGLIKGQFPSFMPKTDETRVQLLQDVITRNKGISCYVTEKIDGSSITCYLKKCTTCEVDGVIADCPDCKGTQKVFGVCSRNLELKEGTDAYWTVVKELKIEEKMRKLGENIAIQGELCGPGIQGNPLKLQEKTIFWFNAFDIDKYRYYDMGGLVAIIIAKFGLKTVPFIEDVWEGKDNWNLIDNIDSLVKMATRKSIVNKDVWAEGIVIRPLEEKTDLQMSQGFGNGRLSFKVINPEYLLEAD